MKIALTLFQSFLVHCLFAQFIGLDINYAGGDGIASPAFAGPDNNSQSHHMIVNGANNSFHFGYTELDGNLVFACAKLDASGDYAPGFGQSGQTAIGTAYPITSLEGADFYPSGKILICGTFYDDNYPNYGGVVFRLNANGIPDPTFSNDLTGSFLQTDFEEENITAIGCSVFDNSKSIAAFTYEDANVVSLMLVKFTSAGDEDQSFDDDGIYFVTLGDTLRVSDIKDDGTDIYLCGYYHDVDANSGIVLKIDQNGDFVSGFGNGFYANLGNSSYDYDPQALCVTEEGSIFVTGRTMDGNAFVGKKDANGQMDDSFGVDGFAYYNNSTSPVGLAIAVAPQGKIMIAGNETDGEGLYHSFVARFNADGTPDVTFDDDGVYHPDFEFEEDSMMGLHVLNDGDFLTTGYGHMSGDADQIICAKFHINAVGIEEANNHGPDLFPNPVTDELFIRTNGTNISTVQITDFTGKIILTTGITNAQTRLDLSSLSAGIYTITITDDSGNRKARNVVKG